MKTPWLASCLLLASYPLSISAASAEENSPHWLERVEPESVGMDPAVLEDIDAVIEQTIEIGHTPGAVVAIGQGHACQKRRNKDNSVSRGDVRKNDRTADGICWNSWTKMGQTVGK